MSNLIIYISAFGVGFMLSILLLIQNDNYNNKIVIDNNNKIN
jgi:hypothetical protein